MDTEDFSRKTGALAFGCASKRPLIFTLLRAGQPVVKTHKLVDGKIVTESGTRPWSGTLETVSMEPDLLAFSAILDGLQRNECVVLGAMRDRRDRAQLMTKEKLAASSATDAIARSRDWLEWRAGTLVPVLFDFDTPTPVAEALDFVRGLDPALSALQVLIRPSSSSFVRSVDGTVDSGLRGLHGWAFIPAEWADAFKPWIAARMRRLGYAHFETSRDGKQLERFPIDLAVLGQPERIAYEADPIVGPGLELYGREGTFQ